MSFINMLENNIWSDQDIINRTESMIRAIIPLAEELILNRKVQGAHQGLYQLTEEDLTKISKLTEISMIARQEGINAKKDMAILLKVFEYEKAKSRLNLPVIESILDEQNNILNQEEINIDLEERNSVQSIIDNADQETVNLYELRNPVIEVAQEIFPEANTVMYGQLIE